MSDDPSLTADNGGADCDDFADGNPTERVVSDAYVWIDPARRSGEPCIGGTRVPVYMVVEMVWANGVTVAEDTWCLSRAQVLVACWYAGYQTCFPAIWRRRWRTWAEQVAGDLWAAPGVDCDAIPDPPSDPTGREPVREIEP